MFITNTRCPLCGSDQIRAKVYSHSDGWSYICDNWADPHEVRLSDSEEDVYMLRDLALERGTRMFYFTPHTQGLEIPRLGIFTISHQEQVHE